MSEKEPLNKSKTKNYGGDVSQLMEDTKKEEESEPTPIKSERTLTEGDIAIIQQLIEHKPQLDIFKKLLDRDYDILKVLELLNTENYPEKLQQYKNNKNEIGLRVPINEPNIKEKATLREFEEIAEKATIIERIEEISGFLKDGSGLDIYQYFAFVLAMQPKTDPNASDVWHDIKQLWEHKWLLLEVLAIAFIQIMSVAVLYIETIHIRMAAHSGSWCMGDGALHARWMAVCYSFLLGLAFHSFCAAQEMGFYKLLYTITPFKADYFCNCFPIVYFTIVPWKRKQSKAMWSKPKGQCRYFLKHSGFSFLKTNWLLFGKIMNYAVLISVIYLSFFIIMVTDDPKNIILSSMAVLFVVGIDNLVVSSWHYEEILKFFRNEENWNDECHTISKKDEGFDLVRAFLWVLVNCLVLIASLSVYVTILAPIAMAYCY